MRGLAEKKRKKLSKRNRYKQKGRRKIWQRRKKKIGSMSFRRSVVYSREEMYIRSV